MSEMQERVAANVVTSENLAEFAAQKLGLVDAPASEAADAEPIADADQSGQDGEGNEASESE